MGIVDSLYTPLEKYHRTQGDGAVIAAGKATADSAKLGAQIAQRENVETFLDKVSKGSDPKAKPTPGQEQLSMAIIDKWKKDPAFLDNLNKDLADPATAAKLEAAAKSNPAALATAMSKYTGGNLAAIIPAAAAAPAAAPPAPAAAPKPATKPPGAAVPPATTQGDIRKFEAEKEAGGTAKPPAAKPPAGATPSPARPPAGDPAAAPVVTAPAVVTGGDPNAPKPPSERDITRGILKEMAKGTDEEIKKSITPKFVTRLADGLADFGEENFKELGPDAQGFRDKIKSNPALQKQIADNLRDNPKLIRDLAEAMDNKDAGKGMVGSAIKGKLKEIYANPAVLADKDYTNALSGQMDMAKGMGGGLGGIGNWMKNTLGIDLNGIGAGLGGFFQGIMNWFGKFFNSFSSGNFALMGNLNPKMGMFDRLQASMERAERADQLRGYEQVLPRNRAKGPIGDGIERNAAGKPVMVEKVGPDGQKTSEPKYDPTADHRITVGGHKFYLTDRLDPSPQRNGQVIWTVATEVNSNGQATKMSEIVLSKEDSDKLYKRMQEAAQAKGQQLQMQDPSTARISEPPASKANINQYDAKTGQPIVRPQPGDPGYEPAFTQPVRPPGPADAAVPGPQEPRPIPVS